MSFFNRISQKERAYLDSLNIPLLKQEKFSMTIDNIFAIVGKGTVVTGIVESGMCLVGDYVIVETVNGYIGTTITDIDILRPEFRQKNPKGVAYKSEPAGLFIRGVSAEDIVVGSQVTIA